MPCRCLPLASFIFVSDAFCARVSVARLIPKESRATWWLVYRTQIGAVLRATAVDPAMVASFGIPIRWVYGFTFVYGCGLAGLAGVLLSPIYAVFPTMGHDFLVMAFAVVIVGGMGSIIGAVVAPHHQLRPLHGGRSRRAREG